MADQTVTSNDFFRIVLPNATIENGVIVADLTTAPSGGPGSFTTLAASGATTLGSTLGVTGAVLLSSTLGVTGACTLAAVGCTTLAASGAVTCGTTLGVTGAVTLSSTLGVTGASTLGALSTSGNVSMVLPTFADNAAAVAGGLAVGRIYKTAAGAVLIVV